MSRRTWKILKWTDEPAEKIWIPLDCPCGCEAEIQSAPLKGGVIIALMGMAYVFDPPSFKPPENHLPDEIQCRYCKRSFVK